MKIQALKPHIFLNNHKALPFAPSFKAPPFVSKLKPLEHDTVSFSGTASPAPQVYYETLTTKSKEHRFKECIQTTADRAYNSDEFLKWADKINYNELIEVAPSIANFDSMQLEDFLLHHYKNGTKEFTKENLSCKNLERILSENIVERNEIEGILTTFPATNRAIGELPSDWGVSSEKFDEVVAAINKIAQTIDLTGEDELSHTDTKYIKSTLSRVLQKPVNVQYIDNGAFGHALNIKVGGAKPVVLKLFKTPPFYDNGMRGHGAGAEPQIGYYARVHNLPNYAKFHFGQVANKYDAGAFYIADFIDYDTEYEPKTKMEKLGLYFMTIGDMNEDNMINGKIVDYGSSSPDTSPEVYELAEEIVEAAFVETEDGLEAKDVCELLTESYKRVSRREHMYFMHAVDFIAFNAKRPYGKEFEKWIREVYPTL